MESVALGNWCCVRGPGWFRSLYLYAGYSFVQIPTSLTAQVDSSIRWKTGVNTPFSKNMVGTFAQQMGFWLIRLFLNPWRESWLKGMGELSSTAIEDQNCEENGAGWFCGSILLERKETLINLFCQVKHKMVVEMRFRAMVYAYTSILVILLVMPLKNCRLWKEIMHGELWLWEWVQISKVAEEKASCQRALQSITAMSRKLDCLLTIARMLTSFIRLWLMIREGAWQCLEVVLVLDWFCNHHRAMEEMKELLGKIKENVWDI